MKKNIIKEIPGLFHIVPLERLRHTNKVDFDIIPVFDWLNWMDMVTHFPWATSPWIVWDKANLWYMHNWQEDNLLTISWNRFVELYTKEHWKIEKFEISKNCIKWNDEVVLDGHWILGWPPKVFHRNYSPEGSISINLAVRNEKFDIDTEFNIYDLYTNTGEYKVERIWKLDQNLN